tara:strand:+ start:13 stop:690 length:678 start_codon:yes stop_codon:yes gene_type:complete
MHQLIDKKYKIIIYLIFLFILSTTSGKFTENKKSYSSTVNIINVRGLSNNDNLKISEKLKKPLNKNILLIRKEEIKKILNQYNIIEEFSIKKVYPSTVNIFIKPTKLVARISGADQLLIGANGKLVKEKKRYKILPYVFGEFNAKEFLVFKKKIEESKFTFSNFKILYFFPSNRWDILTDDDILIKLPQDNFSGSLYLAHKIISSNDFKDIKLIDLRVNNHLIVK